MSAYKQDDLDLYVDACAMANHFSILSDMELRHTNTSQHSDTAVEWIEIAESLRPAHTGNDSNR